MDAWQIQTLQVVTWLKAHRLPVGDEVLEWVLDLAEMGASAGLVVHMPCERSDP